MSGNFAHVLYEILRLNTLATTPKVLSKFYTGTVLLGLYGNLSVFTKYFGLPSFLPSNGRLSLLLYDKFSQ